MGNVVVPLTMLAGGAALVWVGISNPAGGAFAGLGNLVRGLPNQRATTNPAAFASTAADLAGLVNTGGSSVAPAVSTSAGAATGTRAEVLAEANTWLGVPYAFSGNTRSGIDCSGFTLQVFAKVGVHLPRVSFLQARCGRRVAAPQPGDLVAFGSPVHHVGIYLGNGQMINAPKPGSVVRVEPVDYGVHPIIYRDLLTAKASRKARRHRRKGVVQT